MLRPFSAFPGGWAGVGLLGLRFALLVILIGGVAPSIGIRVVLVCAGAMVMAGFVTSFASGVAAAVALGTAGWSLFTGAPLVFDTLSEHRTPQRRRDGADHDWSGCILRGRTSVRLEGASCAGS